MVVTAIVNPIAGAGRRRVETRALWRRLGEAGFRVEIRPTAGPGDARRLAVEAARSAEAVIVVGGDGTVRDVADGLVGSGVPLIVWPTGTENLVAKAFGFRPDPDTVSACLTAGRTRTVDVGRAYGKTFLVVAGVGFDAAVVQRLTRRRQGHITHLSYVEPICRTFCEHRFPRLEVEIDGEPTWEGRGMAFVGNLARYSLGLRIASEAIPADGMLDLVLFDCRGKLDLIRHALRTVLQRHIAHPRVRYLRFQRLRITSPDDAPVELDGDNGGTLPLGVSVVPRALCLRVPPDAPAG